MGRSGSVRRGWARQARSGRAWQVESWHGEAWQARYGAVGCVKVRHGVVGRGMAGADWYGWVGGGLARPGWAWQAWGAVMVASGFDSLNRTTQRASHTQRAH